MSDDDAWTRMSQASASHLRAEGPAILASLLDLDFALAEIVELPGDMAQAYDITRKPKGHQIGAFGPIGLKLFRHLVNIDPLEPDWTIFKIGRVVTVEQLAGEIGNSVGSIKKALAALVEHRFLERIREGRATRLRPLLPRLALIEAVQRELSFAARAEDPPHLIDRRRRWEAALPSLLE